MATDQIYFTDYLDDFHGGVDTNTDSRDLPPWQLSHGLNLSLRGKFANSRPPVRFITIIDPSGLLPAFNGVFQGAGYYKPDSAPESLFVSISGRLFQLTPDNQGNATLSERTIPGDANDATAPQVWMWQAENFLIVNDGIHLPLFFDGTISRRSLGNGIFTAATSSAPFTAPALNSTVVVTVTAPYTGALNVPVQVGGFNYTLTATGTGGPPAFVATVLQTSTFTQTPEPSVSGTFVQPSTFYAFPTAQTIFGVQAAPWPQYESSNNTWPPPPAHLPIPSRFLRTLTISRPFTGSLYQVLYLNVQFWNTNGSITQGIATVGVAAISADGRTLTLVSLLAGNVLSAFPNLAIQGSTSIIWTPVSALTNVTFTVPGTGNSATINSPTNYTGPLGAYAYFTVSPGNTVEFQITNFTNAATTFTVTLLNVNDGSGATYNPPTLITSTASELPVGRMGTYGKGRNWMCLADGASYIGSDLVGSSSGSSQYSRRDAVLHITQNITLAGGLVFRIPNSGDTIRAMAFTNTIDSSLGQGALMIFTDTTVFSCNAPVDATTWANLTNPILTEALKGQGGKGQSAVVLENADIIFRSNGYNIRSLLLARMDYNQWGNTPISNELVRYLNNDDPTLLPFSSGISFDNRVIITARPTSSPRGVYHAGLVALNTDENSALQQKSSSIWEGLWTGLQVFQLVKGAFAGLDRAFAFVFDTPCNTLQLYELLPEVTVQIYDASDFGPVPILWGIETFDLFRGQDKESIRKFKALEDGELAVDGVLGQVTFQVFYKPDQSPGWIPWRTFSVHVDETVPNANSGYFPRLGLGKPDELQGNDGFGPTNSRFGYTFQVRIIITGNCRLLGGRFRASLQPEPEFKTPIDNTQPVPVLSNSTPGINDFTMYDLNNDGNACGAPPSAHIPPQPSRPACVPPGSLPTLPLAGSLVGTGMAYYGPGKTLWIPDFGSKHLFVVQTPVPALLATLDLSSVTTNVTQQALYDSVNDQIVVLSNAAEMVFINPHSRAITGHLSTLVTTSGNGFPYMSYDTKRGHMLVHYVLDTFEPNPVSLVIVDGLTKSVVASTSLPAVGVIGTVLGRSTYVSSQDTFYVSDVNNTQIHTVNPITCAVAFAPLNLPANTWAGILQYVPQLNLVLVGVASTVSGIVQTLQQWNLYNNTLGTTATGPDVTTPWNVRDIVYNPCTNKLYIDAPTGTDLLEFNATTMVEVLKLSGVGTFSKVYSPDQNLVWACNTANALISVA